jgi:HSP20 family protein
MSEITRWDPFRDTMDRLFESGFSRPWRLMQMGTEEFAAPPIEISEAEDEIEVKASLPGMKPEDINISVQGDVVTIKGETREESEDRQKSYYRRELRYGSVQRSITLPTIVDTERSQASYENGILKLRLPKSEEAKPKQIKVQGGDRNQPIDQPSSQG